MNCPLCGSEIANGVKYCPVCGADIEAAQRRSSGQGGQRVDATRRMPPLQDQTAPYAGTQRPSRAAVPMNSSMPQQRAPQRGQQPQNAQNLRSFDTSQMSSTPKWPIVLIVLLALVIIIAVILIIFQPWRSPSQPASNTTTTTQTSQTADGGTTSDGAVVDDAGTTDGTGDAATGDTPAVVTGLSDADAYAQLTDVYGQLGGFNDRISATAEDFNANYLSSDVSVRQASLDSAAALQGEITALQATLDAMVLAEGEGSAYADTLRTMGTLCGDLYHRIDVLVRAWQASVNAGENPAAASDEISSILGADNGEGGVNVYKAEFDSLYPGAAPAAPAA